jgi:hypothetical protein
MMDTILKGGTVVDGTGAAPFVGDVVSSRVRPVLSTLSLCPSGHHLPLPPWPGLADARSPPGRHLQQAIKDGVIAAVGAGLVDAGMKATEVYDATGQHIAPGWIDPHTHFVRSSCSFLSGLQPVPTSWHMQRSPLSLCVV